MISSCIYIATHDTPENKWNVKPKDKVAIPRILVEEQVWKDEKFLELLKNVRNLRNDYNHAGFRNSAQNAATIIGNVKNFIDSMEMIEKTLFAR